MTTPICSKSATRRRLAPPLVAGDSHCRDVVAKHLAPKLGRTVDGAHQVLVGPLNHLAASVIEAHVEAGALDRLARWSAPIEAAFDRRPAPGLTVALIQAAAKIDGEEDAELVCLAAHLSDAQEARTTLRAIYREVSIKNTLARAICKQFGWTA